jgi:hypothetical protein
VFESAEPAVVLVSVQSVAAASVEKLTVVWEDLVTDEAVSKYFELEGVVVGKGVWKVEVEGFALSSGVAEAIAAVEIDTVAHNVDNAVFVRVVSEPVEWELELCYQQRLGRPEDWHKLEAVPQNHEVQLVGVD